MGKEPLGMWLYRAFGVPWRMDDLDEQLKATTKVEYDALIGGIVRGGGVPRWNGSLYYPAKIPDLIGIKDRKYIDHTATHLYYKVPSLKGVWYRGHYLHDGSVASLEEMFDPDRLKEAHVPGGWRPQGSQTYAIKGHEFGLRLDAIEREQLIAFLRTL